MCIYDVYGPCSCPHGRCFTLLAQCFTISSFVTSVLAITSCMFLFVRPIPEEGEQEAPREGFGYVARQAASLEPADYQTCVFYSKDETSEYFDSMWRAGKAMAFLATIVGFGVMCVVMCTCCVAFELPTFDGLFWTCIFCFVAQCLTFLAWGSQLCDDYECTWSSGTGMNITAAMMWIWAANMIKSFPEALPPRGGADGGPRNKDAIYEDDQDAFEDDSPYGPRGAGDDIYDDDYTNAHSQYGDDDTYADQSYDPSYANGRAPPPQMDDDSYYSNDDQTYNTSRSGSNRDDPYNNYATNDYDDPSQQQYHEEDDSFAANSHFQDKWNKGDPNAVDEEQFENNDSNYFQEPDEDESQRLSQEEQEFLGQKRK